MIRKKRRREIINAGYNRYAFNDEQDLPEWFLADESNHNRPSLPVSKKEVDVFKEKLKAIDARPIKKIAEARARKKSAILSSRFSVLLLCCLWLFCLCLGGSSVCLFACLLR
jgi:hypothetical protein